jgi:hypothetical protein
MENVPMKRHPAWLATGILVFVVLACSLGRVKNANNANNTKSDTNSEDSTGVIAEIQMAKDDGNGDPGETTNVFGPSDRTIHCVTKLKEAKSGTKMKFSWWVVDADGTKNESIKDIDYTTKALENVIHGHLTLPQDWPSGKYKCDVYVNGNLEKTALFSVQ